MAAHVLAGTYDGNLYGWEVQHGEKGAEEGAELPMPLRIGTEAHVGSVKSIAVHRVKRGHMIVTGGEDENISLFSLDRLRQVGTLNQHSGSINTFDFFGSSHMLSGGDDAQVAIWRTSDWECIHVLAGHKGPVRSVAVHPSGKLALSTSDDSTLRMWDLVQGRAAYIKRLALPAELVAWAPDGMHFAVVSGNTLYVHRVSDAELEGSFELKGRVYSALFLSDQVLAVAGNDKHIHFCSVAGKSLGQVNTKFRTRVRDVALCWAPPAEDGSPRCWLACASSDGFVQVWDATKVALTAFDPSEGAAPAERIARTAVPEGVRLTCISATPPDNRLGANTTPAEAAQQAVQAHNALVEATGATVGDTRRDVAQGAVEEEEEEGEDEGRGSRRAATRGGATGKGGAKAKFADQGKGKDKGKGKGKKRARRDEVQHAIQDLEVQQRKRQLALEADSSAAREHLS